MNSLKTNFYQKTVQRQPKSSNIETIEWTGHLQQVLRTIPNKPTQSIAKFLLTEPRERRRQSNYARDWAIPGLNPGRCRNTSNFYQKTVQRQPKSSNIETIEWTGHLQQLLRTIPNKPTQSTAKFLLTEPRERRRQSNYARDWAIPGLNPGRCRNTSLLQKIQTNSGVHTVSYTAGIVFLPRGKAIWSRS